MADEDERSVAPSHRFVNASVLDLDGIEALTFDVFGTVVDWRSSIASEGARVGAEKGMEGIDWVAFADSWRGGYTPSMDRVRRGELPWTNIDALHRMILDELLDDLGIDGLTEGGKDHLNRAWHRLAPWPDAVAGLTRLREAFHNRPAVQRQRGAAHEHGQERGAALGLHTLGGAGAPLQAGPGGILDCGRATRTAAHGGDDGRGARLRPRGRAGRGDAGRVRAPSAGVRARPSAGGRGTASSSTSSPTTSKTLPTSSAAESMYRREQHNRRG